MAALGSVTSRDYGTGALPHLRWGVSFVLFRHRLECRSAAHPPHLVPAAAVAGRDRSPPRTLLPLNPRVLPRLLIVMVTRTNRPARRNPGINRRCRMPKIRPVRQSFRPWCPRKGQAQQLHRAASVLEIRAKIFLRESAAQTIEEVGLVHRTMISTTTVKRPRWPPPASRRRLMT